MGLPITEVPPTEETTMGIPITEVIIMEEVTITEATQLNPALRIFPSFCMILPTALGNLCPVG